MFVDRGTKVGLQTKVPTGAGWGVKFRAVPVEVVLCSRK